MATDDDNFDIDIYGDDPNEAQPKEAPVEDELDFSTANDDATYSEELPTQAGAGNEQVKAEQDSKPAHSTGQSQAQQGTKRKAEEEANEDGPAADYGADNYAEGGYTDYTNTKHEAAGDPYAMPALKLTELQWWTTEEDLRAFCAKAGVEDQLKELSFGEHKINGKSRGEAYLEFSSPSAAENVKYEIEKAVTASQSESGSKRKDWLVEYSQPGNGFRMAAGSSGPKKDYQQNSGAYNSRGGYNNERGGRGNFRGNNYNNRGGGFNNRGGMYQQSNPSQGGWGGAGNGMMPNMGAGFNPMMAGMMGNMGGFNGMGMGRGNFNNMGGMGMGRGGMNMMNMGMMARGGWNGGFQGGGQQGGWQSGGGGGGGQMQGGNKRARME